MSTYITSFAEVKRNGIWKKVGRIFPDRFFREVKLTDHPFGNQNYAAFGFLANVRNYSRCDTINSHYGIPEDASPEIKLSYQASEEYSYSERHCYLADLIAFDYEQEFENKREIQEEDPSEFPYDQPANEPKGKIMTYREHLGDEILEHIEILKELGDPEDVRVIYWFYD